MFWDQLVRYSTKNCVIGYLDSKEDTLSLVLALINVYQVGYICLLIVLISPRKMMITRQVERSRRRLRMI